MKWYIIQTRSSYENKVMGEILAKAQEAGVADDVERFFSPEEVVITYKDGVKKESKKRMYPSYIFIRLNYSERVWHAMKKIVGFTGFIGDKNKPHVISDEEIESIEKKLETAAPRPKIEYDLGSRVLLKDGALKDFYGTVDSVDYEKGRIKVNVTIFGRETAVDMELTDVELSK